MAADRSSGKDLKSCLTEENSPKKAVDNDNSVQNKNSKDLLKVRPELELEKYLVKKNKIVDAERKTFKPSACSALSQVKDFLPLMKKAQEELSNTDHNMENIDEDEPCISMDIQFVELDDGETSSDCSEESESEIDHLGEINEDNLILKKTEKITKPLIEDIT